MGGEYYIGNYLIFENKLYDWIEVRKGKERISLMRNGNATIYLVLRLTTCRVEPYSYRVHVKFF